MAKFKVGDCVILDEEYAKENHLYFEPMKVLSVDIRAREYHLQCTNDEKEEF